jgi:hypothetical protein
LASTIYGGGSTASPTSSNSPLGGSGSGNHTQSFSIHGDPNGTFLRSSPLPSLSSAGSDQTLNRFIWKEYIRKRLNPSIFLFRKMSTASQKVRTREDVIYEGWLLLK